MQVVRGRAETPEDDRAATARMLDRTGERGIPALRVWTPHRQIAFGRRDAAAAGYDEAREIASKNGFVPVERSVGGRAVAYTGTTLAFAHARPIADMRRGLTDRYDEASETVTGALRELGVDAEDGEPPDSFCAGSHSLQSEGKLVGIAQRVRETAALVAGIVIVADHEEIAAVLDPIYDALDVPFDPASVGSVVRAGGPDDPDTVARAFEDAFAGGRSTSSVSIGRFLDGS